MKFTSTLVLLTLFALQGQAQIFNSGFENNNGTPLADYTKINNDGMTVPVFAPVPAFDTAAWIQFYDGYDNKIAFSTSWYDPAGQSDDWLIAPAITVPEGGQPTLYWKAKSYDFEALDDYQVRVSTTDDQMESFTDTLLTITGEQPFEYASRSLDLSAYEGQTIYLAFVNITFDGFYLALDDLYISNSADCYLPEIGGISVSDLSESGFTVAWNPTPDIAVYDLGLTTFTTPVSSEGTQTDTTKSYEGLDSGTRYQFFLKNADCGSGWTTPHSIWTAAIPPYSYDFEYTEENYGEYDSDGWSSMTWINGFGENAQSQDGYVYNNTSTSFDKDDWIFSYPIKLEAGEELAIEYHLQLSEVASAAIFKVSAATAPDKSANFLVLDSLTITDTEYQQFISVFEAEQTGVYYFGFGNVTPAVAENATLRLDNIGFTYVSAVHNPSSPSGIKAFPNPVMDRLYVHTDQNIDRIDVYSVNGRLIESHSDVNEIDFSDRSQGVYMVKIVTDHETAVKKIIK